MEVFPPISFPMLEEVVTLVLARLQILMYLLQFETEGSLDFTPSSLASEIALVYLTARVPSQKSLKHLFLEDPLHRFWGKWYPPRFDASAFVLGMNHVVFPLLIQGL